MSTADPSGAGHRGQASVLFTAFEPSGDAHAAPVIAELLRRVPMLKVYAWGGPRMEKAGATILGRTAEDGAMGLGSFKRIREVKREIRRIKQWAREYRVIAHVAVDSPAANFPVCRTVKKTGARIIHLVAPQMWAWGRWRVGKLRKLTDLVLCLLPHEEQWFNDRGVPAKFIGHPALNRPVETDETVREQMHGLPQGAPRIAIFPGSRSQEVKANIRLLVNAFIELQGRHAGMAGVIVAANQNLAKVVRKKIKVFPSGMHMVTGQADAAIGWCDLALAVSGTITLDITRQRKPMIGVYRTGLLSWLTAKLLVRGYYLLPNVVADREVVPEFVPHLGGCMPIVKVASRILLDSKKAANQSEELNRICLRFAGKKPAEEATRLIIKVMRDGMLQENR
jgi:lipid-A-disaccharide synthase